MLMYCYFYSIYYLVASMLHNYIYKLGNKMLKVVIQMSPSNIFRALVDMVHVTYIYWKSGRTSLYLMSELLLIRSFQKINKINREYF